MTLVDVCKYNREDRIKTEMAEIAFSSVLVAQAVSGNIDSLSTQQMRDFQYSSQQNYDKFMELRGELKGKTWWDEFMAMCNDGEIHRRFRYWWRNRF